MTLVTYDQDTRKQMMQLLGISGTANEIDLLFKLAEHYQLDVLTKEISLIPKKGPFIGVWGRLHIAHRSDKLDGLEMDDEWETDKHYCVRVIVWRKDMRHPAAKVVGRVGKHEGFTDRQSGEFTPKEWPLEIARARGLRAGLGFAFTIHDTYDTQADTDDDWAPIPDERVTATGQVIEATAAAPEEVNGDKAAAPTPKRRRIQPTTGTAEPSEKANASGSERNPGPGQTDNPPPPEEPVSSAPGPDTEPRTIVVGGHSLAQQVAMAAKRAGIDDDQTRHGIVRVLTGGEYQRSTDIPDDAQEIWDHILEGFEGLHDGSLYYRCNPDGTVRGVYRTRKA